MILKNADKNELLTYISRKKDDEHKNAISCGLLTGAFILLANNILFFAAGDMSDYISHDDWILKSVLVSSIMYNCINSFLLLIKIISGGSTKSGIIINNGIGISIKPLSVILIVNMIITLIALLFTSISSFYLLNKDFILFLINTVLLLTVLYMLFNPGNKTSARMVIIIAYFVMSILMVLLLCLRTPMDTLKYNFNYFGTGIFFVLISLIISILTLFKMKFDNYLRLIKLENMIINEGLSEDDIKYKLESILIKI